MFQLFFSLHVFSSFLSFVCAYPEEEDPIYQQANTNLEILCAERAMRRSSLLVVAHACNADNWGRPLE